MQEKCKNIKENGAEKEVVSADMDVPEAANDAEALKEGGPRPDSDMPLDFLRKFRPEGPWVLTAISPSKRGIETASFDPGTERECKAWVNKNNGFKNIYFNINPSRVLNKKSAETDVTAVEYFHVDIDADKTDNLPAALKEIESRLTDQRPEDIPEPTFIWMSGGGFWAVWKLTIPKPTDVDMMGSDPAINKEVLDRIEDLKLRSVWLEEKLGADQCHNLDRIARLPGTINLPDEKKIAKGRQRALAQVVSYNPDAVYTLNDFQKGKPKILTSPILMGLGKDTAEPGTFSHIEIDKSAVQRVELDALPQSVPGDIRKMIQTGKHPARKGRSETVFAVVCGLLKSKTDPQVIYSILLDASYPISAHVREQRNHGSYAVRQIKKGWAAISEFQCDEKGRVLPNRHNIRLALLRMGVSIQRNEMNGRNEVTGLDGYGPYWDDDSDRRIRVLLDDRFKIKVTRQFLEDTILDDAYTDRHHPVRDHLDDLRWDGEPRLDTFLIDCAGAKDTEFVRAVSRIVLVAAVRRVRQPGCKFDELLILEGEQGGNKSTALKQLAKNPEWFSDNLPLTGDSKVAIEQTQGKWIIECAELKGKGRGESADTLKNFLSMDTDRARMAYGRHPVEVPRQWVAIGTTNKGQYLHDPTGNRRFWPVRVGKFDLEKMTPEYVEQLWAEASYREAEGELIRLNPALYQAAAEEQRERVEDDPWWDTVVALVGDDSSPCKVASETVWKVVGLTEVKDRTQKHNVRLGALMRQLGFEAARFNISGRKKSGYARGLVDGNGLRGLPLIDTSIAPLPIQWVAATHLDNRSAGVS